MISFVCNICGEPQQVEAQLLDREIPSCEDCGSNVRFRSLVHLLSLELFGESLTLPEMPRLKRIRGLGLSDWSGYGDRLAEIFDYRNTHFDREPRLDITDVPADEVGRHDFVIASEVFEHVPQPVERAFSEAYRLLAPNGFLLLTVPYGLGAHSREHFPNLHQWTLAEVEGETVVVNRRRDGSLEAFDGLVFHGGSGSTLEMRVFGEEDLKALLLGAGFSELRIFAESFLPHGVAQHKRWSLPIVARKEPFAVKRSWFAELARELGDAERRVTRTEARLAAESAELENARTRLDELHAEFDERSRWALSLDRDLGDTRAKLESLTLEFEERTLEFEERTRWALEAKARVEHLERELGRLRSSFVVRAATRLGLAPESSDE